MVTLRWGSIGKRKKGDPIAEETAHGWNLMRQRG